MLALALVVKLRAFQVIRTSDGALWYTSFDSKKMRSVAVAGVSGEREKERESGKNEFINFVFMGKVQRRVVVSSNGTET